MVSQREVLSVGFLRADKEKDCFADVMLHCPHLTNSSMNKKYKNSSTTKYGPRNVSFIAIRGSVNSSLSTGFFFVVFLYF